MTTSITTNNLTKRYPSQSAESRPALDHYELLVEAGQLFGLIGPAGAGKTTLLRILSTVLNPTSGSAQVAELYVTKQSEQVQSQIGYIPQSFSLYPNIQDYQAWIRRDHQTN
jgi:ABC-2 type transport system ATP-binding protein